MLTNHQGKISVVIPTYNEGKNIAKLIPMLVDLLDSVDFKGYIVVVDDNSPDGTFQVVKNFCKIFKNVFIIRREGRLGLGSACAVGFRFSIYELEADVIITMDADFSHDPSRIPEILEKLNEGYDIVIGSRYIHGGGVKDWSRHRVLVSHVANSLIHHLLSMDVKDVTSNFRAYRSTVLKAVDLAKIESNDFSFVPELLYKCRRRGFKVGEVPVFYVERRLGRSKLDVKEIFSFLKTVFRLAFTRKS